MQSYPNLPDLRGKAAQGAIRYHDAGWYGRHVGSLHPVVGNLARRAAALGAMVFASLLGLGGFAAALWGCLIRDEIPGSNALVVQGWALIVVGMLAMGGAFGLGDLIVKSCDRHDFDPACDLATFWGVVWIAGCALAGAAVVYFLVTGA